MLIDSTIHIENLVVGYQQGNRDIFKYKPLTCNANKGELIALIGRNGVGKSTLLRSIAKLQRPLSGSINILGKNLAQVPSNMLAKQVSYIPAEPVHSPNTTISDFVSLARYPYHGWFNYLTKSDLQIVDDAIGKVGLAHLSHRFIDSLSDGERQRTMIAFAIAQDTSIVLMDEPTAFLDLPNKFEVVRLLKELSLTGKTVILSTHDIQTALSMVDTIWLMLPNGLKIGAPEDLILSNTINELMAGTKVQLDSFTGQFVYQTEHNRIAFLQATNETHYNWTLHALERNGFETTNAPLANSILVEVIEEKQAPLWKVKNGTHEFIFSSIGEMSQYLNAGTKQA